MNPQWPHVLALSLGGAAGANTRFWLGGWVAARWGTDFPWSTFLVNVSGALAAGLASHLLERFNSALFWRHLLIAGFLGGYTTFSAFELETLGLIFRRYWMSAACYVLGSVALGLVAVGTGYALGRLIGAIITVRS